MVVEFPISWSFSIIFNIFPSPISVNISWEIIFDEIVTVSIYFSKKLEWSNIFSFWFRFNSILFNIMIFLQSFFNSEFKFSSFIGHNSSMNTGNTNLWIIRIENISIYFLCFDFRAIFWTCDCEYCSNWSFELIHRSDISTFTVGLNWWGGTESERSKSRSMTDRWHRVLVRSLIEWHTISNSKNEWSSLFIIINTSMNSSFTDSRLININQSSENVSFQRFRAIFWTFNSVLFTSSSQERGSQFIATFIRSILIFTFFLFFFLFFFISFTLIPFIFTDTFIKIGWGILW